MINITQLIDIYQYLMIGYVVSILRDSAGNRSIINKQVMYLEMILLISLS